MNTARRGSIATGSSATTEEAKDSTANPLSQLSEITLVPVRIYRNAPDKFLEFPFVNAMRDNKNISIQFNRVVEAYLNFRDQPNLHANHIFFYDM